MFLQDSIKIFDKEIMLDKKCLNRKTLLTIDDGDLDVSQEVVISKISKEDFYNIYKIGEKLGLEYENILDKMVEKHLIIRLKNENISI